jgi:hypothetical protein
MRSSAVSARAIVKADHAFPEHLARLRLSRRSSRGGAPVALVVAVAAAARLPGVRNNGVNLRVVAAVPAVWKLGGRVKDQPPHHRQGWSSSWPRSSRGLCAVYVKSIGHCAVAPARRAGLDARLDVAGLDKPLQQVELRQAVNAERAYRRERLIRHGLLRDVGFLPPKLGYTHERYRGAGLRTIHETETYSPLNAIVNDGRHRLFAKGHDASADATLAAFMFPHPWLRLNIAIRTMLSTRWGDE